MENKNNAVNGTQSAAAVIVADDLEEKVNTLEAEKARLIEENANWKLAALKNKGKIKDENLDEDEEEKMQRIANEAIANSRLAQITREQDVIIKKALKENKELKLAQINRTTNPPAAMGGHSETQQVADTLVTQEQLNAFKARGWSDKDIARYKKNLGRASGR